MMRVALYGGAFDPPNMAHVYAVTALLARSDVDQVWVMPAANHAFGKQMTPFAERVAMLQAALQDFNPNRVQICTYEQDFPVSGRTYDTLDALTQSYPGHEFTFVMGADNLTEAYRWYRFDDLVRRWKVIVLGRPGHEAAMQAYMHEPWLKQGPCLPAISSTQVRAALRRGERVIPDLPARCLPMALQIYKPSTKTAFGPVWVLGAGRAGQSICGALRGAMIDCRLWNRSAPNPERPTLYPYDAWGELPDSLGEAPLWMLTVDDRAILPMAERLAREKPDLCKGRVVIHCAGRLSSRALDPLAQLGAETGSFHPLQSLGQLQDFYGVYCALEGSERTLELLHRMTAILGMKTVEIQPEQKALYHASAVLAGNFPSTMAEAAVLLLKQMGLSDPTARQMLSPLLQSAISRFGLVDLHKALTGPAARGDREAMAQHMEALRALKEGGAYAELYEAASRMTEVLLQTA